MIASPSFALLRRHVADARTRSLSFSGLFFAIIWSNAVGYRDTYPHQADRLKLVATFADNKAARMLYGYGHNLTTVGGYTAWRAGGLLVLFAGLFGIFASTRAMRTDEDNGRSELVLSGLISRTRGFWVGVFAIALTVLVVLVAAALGGIAGGLSSSGSCFLALAIMSVAIWYAALAALTNQVFPTRRSALGVAGAVLGADFLVRIAADTTDHTAVHWFTPLGWAEELRAFSGSRPIVLVLPLATAILLLFSAAWLRAHRDLGAGYVSAHDTAEARTRLLSSPFALAFRLDRLTIASWTIAIAAFALVIGTVAKTVEKLDLPASLRDQIKKLGGIDVTQAKGYVGLTFVVFVFAIALFVCGQLAAARDEESSSRLETLFALPYGRTRWLTGRIALTGIGVTACALVAGAGAGIGVVLTRGHMTFLEGLAGGLNLLPAEMLFLGVGVLFLALTPRHGVGLLYAFVVIAFVWELFGALLSFPNWVLDLSPFHHIAPVPARPVAAASAAALAAAGIAAAAAGIARFRARDLATD